MGAGASKRVFHTMGAGASKKSKGTEPKPAESRLAQPLRLVLYSERATSLPGFEEALKLNKSCTVGAAYRFEDPGATTADALIALIGKLVKRHTGGRGFESIALATHGPACLPEPPRSGETCRWMLSQHIEMTDPTELQIQAHPLRRVLEAMGRATVEGGNVDLLTCGILRSWRAHRSAGRSLWRLEIWRRRRGRRLPPPRI